MIQLVPYCVTETCVENSADLFSSFYKENGALSAETIEIHTHTRTHTYRNNFKSLSLSLSLSLLLSLSLSLSLSFSLSLSLSLSLSIQVVFENTSKLFPVWCFSRQCLVDSVTIFERFSIFYLFWHCGQHTLSKCKLKVKIDVWAYNQFLLLFFYIVILKN